MTTIQQIASQAVEDAIMARQETSSLLINETQINYLASKFSTIYTDKIQRQAYEAVFCNAYKSGNANVAEYL